MMILCIIRSIYLLYTAVKINHIHITQIYDIKINPIINFLNHVVYIIFSYIVQFLSFIFYIEIFPEKFVIKKKDSFIKMNEAFMALNAFFILAYNVYNYLFIQLAIMPKRFQKMSLNMQIHNPKLYYFIAFQNISL